MSSIALEKFLEQVTEIEDLDKLVTLKTKGAKGPAKGISVARRSAVLLLNAHFEAYLEDVMQEALTSINPKLNANHLAREFTTPRPDNIDKFFSILGIEKISKQISWKKASNEAVRNALNELQNRRNEIAHGTTVDGQAKKAEVTRFRGYAEGFCKKVDDIVRDQVAAMTGRQPW